MRTENRQSGLVASLIFLVVFIAYFLLSPGRIDTMDSQIRLEGTRGVLATGLPLIDPVMKSHIGATKTSLGDSVFASGYGVSPHLVYAPFLKVILLFNRGLDFEQFWFSHINHLFAAGTISLLFLFYLSIGFQMKSAALWALGCAFFTQFFVTGASSFYQSFQAFSLFASFFLAYRAGRSQSLVLALVSALMFAVFINIKPGYVIFAPVIVLLLVSREGNRIEINKYSIMRVLLFGVICLLGLCFWEFYRSLYMPVPKQVSPDAGGVFSSVKKAALGGNILTGLAILLVSPGKGALFFSPILFTGIWGVKRLFAADRLLALTIGCAVVIWLLGVAQTTFPGGDFCWGPRYLLPAIPLIFLFVPYGYSKLFADRPGKGKVLLGYCLAVQLLGLSVDYHQYFFRNGLSVNFWDDQSYYFLHSQLIERPIDIIESIKHVDNLDLAGPFRPGIYPESLTFAIFGGYHPDRNIMIMWMRQYPVFWLPGPWPLWMQFLAPERLPINLGVTVLSAVALLLIGLLLLYRVLFGADKGEENLSEVSNSLPANDSSVSS